MAEGCRQAERLSVAVVLVTGRGSGSWAGLRRLRLQVAGLASGSWAGWRLRLEASDLLKIPGVLVLVLVLSTNMVGHFGTPSL